MSGDFPYIAGEKMPLHYYSMLYPYLDSIWREAIGSLRDLCGFERVGRRGVLVECGDPEDYSSVLLVLHTSFFDIDGWLRGRAFFDRRRYLVYLSRVYGPRMAAALRRLAERVAAGDLAGGYEAAVEAVRVAADAETMNVMSGGRVNYVYFHMLHGGIPVTYINTWRLSAAGAEPVKRISGEIYRSVVEEAVLAARKLEVVSRHASWGKDAGAGVAEP